MQVFKWMQILKVLKLKVLIVHVLLYMFYVYTNIDITMLVNGNKALISALILTNAYYKDLNIKITNITTALIYMLHFIAADV